MKQRTVTIGGSRLNIETLTEARIISDSEWQEGAIWGKPRPGHPEGTVAAHIADVLVNVDMVAIDDEDRERLRLVALIHDTFKHKVDSSKARSGENHHAMLARRFAERYIDDDALLDVIELHDEAYNSWGKGERSGNWGAATARAEALISRLGDQLGFYLRFYQADNETGSKDATSYRWFRQLAESRLNDDLPA